MKICLNYYGQPRDIGITSRVFDEFIKTDTQIEYHVVWTTWTGEDLSAFKQLFPTSYVKQYDPPSMDNYKHITSVYDLDVTNRCKTISHYVAGLYIKYKSAQTIADYENEYGIEFDMIITLRCDTIIHDNHLAIFYKPIIENIHNTVFLACGPKFDVYHERAEADSMFIANKQVTFLLLSQLDILPHCVINNTRHFHPETAFAKAIHFLNLRILCINIRAFPQLLH